MPDEARRQAAGFENVAVFRDVDDADNLLVVQEHAADKAAVQAMLDAMMADPGLAEAMQAAGVRDAPEMWLG